MPHPSRNLKVFISSPGDVSEERALAELVFRRLADEYRGKARIEVVLWEHEPLFGHTGFQEQIERPSSCDLVVSILWSRLGTRLPSTYAPQPGTPAPTGTEFEINDALEAYNRLGKPNLLIYRKAAKPSLDMTRADAEDRLRQYQRLDEFCRRAFYDENGSVMVAHHKFVESWEFEHKLYTHARKWLEQQLPGASAGAGPSWTRGSPFRGLQVFEAEHRAIYFGRRQAVSDVMGILRRREVLLQPDEAVPTPHFLLIQGMSGNGKSSLVRAGLLPLLESRALEGVGCWFVVALRPSDRQAGLESLGMFGALAARLAVALPTLENTATAIAKLAQRLDSAPEQVAALLEGYIDSSAKQVGLQRRQVRLLLFIDQLEELFTGTANTVQVDRVAQAITALARSVNTWVVATMRSDFADRFERVATLVDLARGEGTYTLAPPRASELAEMVREPALAAGLAWQERDGVSLDRVLLQDAEANPECLPRLEYALDRLYGERDGNTLTYAAYESMRGLHGALAADAEVVVNAGAPASLAAFPRLMRSLVSVNEQGVAARRYAPLNDVQIGNPERELLDALVQRRLCITDRRGSEPVAALAHDSLIHSWPRVSEWLARESGLLATRDAAEREAATWASHAEGDAWLASEPDKLAEYSRLEFNDVPRSGMLRRFIEASRRRASRRRRLQRTAIVAIASLAVVSTVAAVFALRSRNALRDQQGQTLLAVARQLDDASLQVPLLLDAAHLSGSQQVLTQLAVALLGDPPSMPVRLAGPLSDAKICGVWRKPGPVLVVRHKQGLSLVPMSVNAEVGSVSIPALHVAKPATDVDLEEAPPTSCAPGAAVGLTQSPSAFAYWESNSVEGRLVVYPEGSSTPVVVTSPVLADTRHVILAGSSAVAITDRLTASIPLKVSTVPAASRVEVLGEYDGLFDWNDHGILVDRDHSLWVLRLSPSLRDDATSFKLFPEATGIEHPFDPPFDESNAWIELHDDGTIARYQVDDSHDMISYLQYSNSKRADLPDASTTTGVAGGGKNAPWRLIASGEVASEGFGDYTFACEHRWLAIDSGYRHMVLSCPSGGSAGTWFTSTLLDFATEMSTSLPGEHHLALVDPSGDNFANVEFRDERALRLLEGDFSGDRNGFRLFPDNEQRVTFSADIDNLTTVHCGHSRLLVPVLKDGRISFIARSSGESFALGSIATGLRPQDVSMPHSSIVVVAGAIAAVVDEQVVVWPWPSRARIYCEAAAGASEEESSDLGTAVPADGLSALVDDTVSDWMATAYGSVPTAAEAYLALGPNTVSIYEVTERDEAVRTFTLAGNAWREELRSPWPELKAEAQGTPRWTLVSSRPGSNLKEPSIWMLPGALFGLVSGEGPGGRWDDRVELVDIAPGASLVDWAVGDDPVGMVQQSGRNTFVMDGSDHVLLPIDTGPLQLGATDRQIVLACAGPRVLDVQSSAPLARDLTRDCASEIRRVALQLRDTPVWSMTFWKWAQASRLDTHWTTGLPDPILALTTAEN